MRSTFGGIEISKRGILTQQAALTTAGHNVANANTPGFSRQVVKMVASEPIEALSFNRSTIPGQMGQGVQFTEVKRIREAFLDKQYANENKSLGEWTVRQDTLEKLEAIINEPSNTGLRQVLDNFWNSWQELSKQPDNLETRAVVKESALAVTDAFNHAAKQLNDLASDLNDNITVKVTQVNTTLKQIAGLNNEIFRVEGLGNNANDLRDQRDLLVDELSKVINVSVQEESGGYRVKMGNQDLVVASTATEFDENTVASAYPADLNSGELYGLVLSNQRYVTEYKNQLNSMVSTIVTSVNTAHKEGYTLQDPPTKGGDFFAPVTDFSTAAATFKVSANITDNVENIAASSKTYFDASGVEHVVKGNNELALKMAGIKNQKYNFDGSGVTKIILNGGTFDEFLRAVVSEIGVQTQEAQRQVSNQKILVDQVDARRQSVSGVSLDEEMADMIKYQHAYNAAARSLTTFDEMLDKVINSMGMVGR
ncbi:flagellar hook-associated protein FlgK [Paenibacillus oryzisoli]|uniref:Flagellar hook-associated protein 1 n=1 Tax=Paenibacillus oryzisoli TaxID=1850517 RepID=A0A198A031_9BACL|nr:flagellar hook-associated protein FlgK [Paenibacillus oryzisoli]OAS14530.1 flagellar hook-associated protein FlgK [Paenibacillus oryzisoli]